MGLSLGSPRTGQPLTVSPARRTATARSPASSSTPTATGLRGRRADPGGRGCARRADGHVRHRRVSGRCARASPTTAARRSSRPRRSTCTPRTSRRRWLLPRPAEGRQARAALGVRRGRRRHDRQARARPRRQRHVRDARRARRAGDVHVRRRGADRRRRAGHRRRRGDRHAPPTVDVAAGNEPPTVGPTAPTGARLYRHRRTTPTARSPSTPGIWTATGPSTTSSAAGSRPTRPRSRPAHRQRRSRRPRYRRRRRRDRRARTCSGSGTTRRARPRVNQSPAAPCRPAGDVRDRPRVQEDRVGRRRGRRLRAVPER